MLAAQSIRKTWPGGLKVLDDVSLSLERGEAAGLSGESGCGKSTLARILCGLVPWDRGLVSLDGKALNRPPRTTAERRAFYRKVQIIFQDSSLSLDPRLTVFQTLEEPLDNFGRYTRREKARRIGELLEEAALPPEKARAYPHELSGGQRQRVSIARALAVRPEYLICDEPVSSLDAAVRSHILELLISLQKQYGMGLLFISHDPGLTKKICGRTLEMEGGKLRTC